MYYKSARCYATIFFSHECASLVERFYVIRNSKGVCYYIKKVHKETTPVVVYPFMRLNIKIHNHSHNSHKPNELLHSDLIITFFNHLSTPYSACIPSKTYFVRHKTLTFPKQKPYQTFPVNPPIYYTKSRNCSLFSHFILIKILLRVIILSE